VGAEYNGTKLFVARIIAGKSRRRLVETLTILLMEKWAALASTGPAWAAHGGTLGHHTKSGGTTGTNNHHCELILSVSSRVYPTSSIVVKND
jgi:hypothetical protein